jgi:hypothetical protein
MGHHSEESVPHHLAFEADGCQDVIEGVVDGDETVAATWSTTEYKAPEVRDARKCVGNDNTCKGWKAQGTKFCSGHLKAVEAEDAK